MYLVHFTRTVKSETNHHKFPRQAGDILDDRNEASGTTTAKEPVVTKSEQREQKGPHNNVSTTKCNFERE